MQDQVELIRRIERQYLRDQLGTLHLQMVDGMAKMGDGQFERTLFTSGYSSKTNTYYMNTYDDPAIRSYAMAEYDMDSSELISVAR